MNEIKNITDFIKKTPKTELHLHIEGSLEPELMFKLSKRNKTEIDLLKEMIDEIYIVKRFNFLVKLFNPSTIVLRIKSQRKKNNVYRIKLRFFSDS